MNLRLLYKIRRRIRDLLYFAFRRPDQRFVMSEGSLLECNTRELGYFVWRSLLPLVGTTPFPPHELMLMGAAMVGLRPTMVVEWGTNIGVSAWVFHELNVHYKIGAEIHSIDLPDNVDHIEHPHRWRGLLAWGLPVILHQGDGPVIAAALAKRKQCLDPLVFIDGDHNREMVIRDARTILEAAPRARLLFHDTFYQPTSRYNHGPHEAVQTIVNELGDGTQVIETGLGCPGMTLVLHPRDRTSRYPLEFSAVKKMPK